MLMDDVNVKECGWGTQWYLCVRCSFYKRKTEIVGLWNAAVGGEVLERMRLPYSEDIRTIQGQVHTYILSLNA